MKLKPFTTCILFVALLLTCTSTLRAQAPAEADLTDFNVLLLTKNEQRQMVIPGQYVIVRQNLPKTRPVKGYISDITESGIVLAEREIPMSRIKKLTVKNVAQQRIGLIATLSGLLMPMAASGVVELAGEDWALNNPISFERFSNTVAALSTASFVAGVAVVLTSQKGFRDKKWTMEILRVSPQLEK